MSSRTASTALSMGPARDPAPVQSTLARTKLDWAIIASLLAMGAINLYAMADQFGPAKAYAATHEAGLRTHACGAPLA